MSVTVTRTKIRVPRRRDDLLTRARLNTALDDLLDYTFTMISAPAGYGKTSLMIDLAHRAPFPTCWYSIDSLDKDPLRFFTHFVHSIRFQFPDCGENFLSLLNEVSGTDQDPSQLVSTLVNDLYYSIQEHFVVFLDDYHTLGNQPFINAFISQLGQRADDNFHLVMASRTKFNLPDQALMVGRKMVQGIDTHDLIFRADEIKAYLETKHEQPITIEESKSLHSKTEGWITGLLLVACQGDALIKEQAKAVKVTGANIQDYFYSEVLCKQPPQMQELLTKTALLPEFNAKICCEIFGDSQDLSWKEFSDKLLENNLFVELVEDEQAWIRYHHLFRDFLLERLAKDNPEWKNAVMSRVLTWQKERENWEQAFTIAQLIGDPALMGEIILEASSPLFHAGRIRLLADWMEILPEEGYLSNPYLIALKGFCTTELGEPYLGISYLNKAINNHRNISQEELAQAYIWLSTANRFIGKYPEALRNGLNAYKISYKLNKESSIEAESTREIGLAYSRLGNNNKAIQYLKISKTNYQKNYREINAAQVKMDIGYLFINIGKLREAQIQFRNALSTWHAHNNYNHLSLTINNLGYISILLGDFIHAFKLIKKAHKFAEKKSNMRMVAFSTGSFGDLAASIHLFSKAIMYYKLALSISENINDKYLSTYFYISLGTCHRYLHELSVGHEHINIAHALILDNSESTESGLWNLEKGYYLLEKGMPDEAFTHFRASKNIFHKSNRVIELAKTQLGLLLYHLAADDQNGLEAHLQDFSSTLAAIESSHPLLPEVCHHYSILKRAPNLFEKYPEISNLIIAADTHQAALPALQKKLFPPQEKQISPDSLAIRTFGGIEVLRGGAKITASEWIHQKTVREILFYLLSRPRGVTKEQLGLAFWPDSPPDLLSCQFKNSIYRLRRALGKESVVYDPDTRTYRFNRQINHSYDVDSFLAVCKKAETEPIPGRRFELYRQAVALYGHPFAPELDGVWAEPVRRELYLKYEKARLFIAEFELENQNYSACRDACLAVLELEPCHEKALELCMLSLSKLDKKIEIHRQFTIYEAKLKDDLGLSPSSSTQNLYNKLTN